MIETADLVLNALTSVRQALTYLPGKCLRRPNLTSRVRMSRAARTLSDGGSAASLSAAEIRFFRFRPVTEADLSPSGVNIPEI